MAHYLLVVEAVDIYDTVLDTDDLSTIRGSSLALLKIPELLGGPDGALMRHCLASGDSLSNISLGASRGVWQLETQLSAIDIETACQDLLSDRSATGSDVLSVAAYMRFVAACVPFEADTPYIAALAEAQARIRWQQMTRPGVRHTTETARVPAGRDPVDSGIKNVKLPDSAVCSLNRVLPRKPVAANIKGQTRWVSSSVAARRTYGVTAKQGFYTEQIATLSDGNQPSEKLRHLLRAPTKRLPLPLHFASISEANNQDLKAPLRDKLAIFYADGNRFTGLQRDHIAGADAPADQVDRQQELDELLRTERRWFLKELLELVAAEACGAPNPAELEERQALRNRDGVGNDEAVELDTILRLETLLWGGDEFRFVLPARLGFAAVQLFYDITRGRHKSGKLEWQIGDTPLTHAAGLVFCHHDAPIANIIRLGDRLADACKDTNNSRDLVCAVVLESFDHVGDDIDSYLALQAPAGLKAAQLFIPPEYIGLLVETAQKLNEAESGRRQLRQIVSCQHRDGTEGDDYKRTVERFFTLYPDLKRALAPSQEALGHHALWLMLEEFWDYLLISDVVVPSRPADTAGAAA